MSAPAPSFSSFPSFASSSTAAPSRSAPVFDSFPSLEPDSDGKPSKRRKHRKERSRSRSRSRERSEDDRADKRRRKEAKKEKKSRKEERASDQKEKGKQKAKGDDDEATAFLQDLGRDFGFDAQRRNRPDSNSAAPTRQPEAEPPPLYGRSTHPAGEKKLFVVDLKDDNFNLRWGKPEKGKVPRYHRVGAGRVLGLHENLRIALATAYRGDGLHVSPFGRHRAARLADSSSVALLNDKSLKRIVLQPRRLTGNDKAGGVEAEAGAPYIPLGDGKVSKRSLEHEPGQEYRSVLGLADPHALSSDEEAGPSSASSSSADSDEADGRFHYKPPSHDGGQSLLDRLASRKSHLESLTRSSPTDVEAWLACVRLQDELKEAGLVGIRAARGKDARTEEEREREEEEVKRQMRGAAEVKVAYLERALGVKANAGNLRLVRAYLEAYGQRPDVDFDKVDRKWRDMLRGLPTTTKGKGGEGNGKGGVEVEARMGLWIDYIGWRMSDGGSFRVDEGVRLVEEGMEAVRREFEDEEVGSEKRATGEQTLLYLFHRCCVMLRQAGYAERSLALFQTLLELTFFPPPSHAITLLTPSSSPEDVAAAQNELLEDFELFWDGEAARIGEEGAKGWGMTAEDAEPFVEESSQEVVMAAEQPDDPHRALDSWQAKERTNHLRRLKPARTVDPSVDEDDPYRIVLFDDLRNLLFVPLTSEARHQLVYAFLSFLGLPLAPPGAGTNAPYFTDAFLASDIADSEEAETRFWRPAEEGSRKLVGEDGFAPEIKSGIRHPFSAPFKLFPANVSSLFAPENKWFVPFSQAHLLSRVDVPFVRNVFALLRPVLKSDRYFSLSYLSFEARLDPAAAAKLAKSWLAVDSTDVLIWDAHARIARLRGRVKEMRNAYATTLEMGAGTFTGEAKRDLAMLWHSWVEGEMELGNEDMALSVAVASVGASGDRPSDCLNQAGRPAGAALLRARKAFAASVAVAFQPGALPDVTRHRLSLVTTFATFEHLTQGFDAACSIFDSAAATLQALDFEVEEEELWVQYSRLLYYHLTRSTLYRPAQIRSILQRAVERFPQNSVFGCLFAYNEARTKIQNETRLVIERSLLRSADVTATGWLFAIWVELHINAAGFSKEAVRHLFERAVANDRTCHCAQIWLLYITFEVKYGQTDRARRVIARAHAACPWSKDLYLPPFSTALSAGYSVSPDLERFVRLLGEKTLRVSSDPAPLLSRLASVDEDNMSEDEVEKAESLDRQHGALLSL